MRRVLFELNGIKIYSYPAMLYLGLNLGVVAENFAAKAAHLDTLRVFICDPPAAHPRSRRGTSAAYRDTLAGIPRRTRADMAAEGRRRRDVWFRAVHAHRLSAVAQCIPNSVWFLLGCGNLPHSSGNDLYANRLSAERLLLGADIEFLDCDVPT